MTRLSAASICVTLTGLLGLGLAIPLGTAAAEGTPKAKPAHTQRKTEPVRKARTEALPCPRAQWKGDPVCADAPDEHTLPMPHLNRPTLSKPDEQTVNYGVKWQANNRITEPTPRLIDRPGDDFQSRNTPADTHATVGVDMKF